MVAEYATLASKQDKLDVDSQRLDELRIQLDNILGSKETELESTVAKAVRKVLADQSLSGGLNLEAVEPEIKRQIQEIFGSI